jgi:hypothetical protein
MAPYLGFRAASAGDPVVAVHIVHTASEVVVRSEPGGEK